MRNKTGGYFRLSASVVTNSAMFSALFLYAPCETLAFARPMIKIAEEACKSEKHLLPTAPIEVDGYFRTKEMRWYDNTSRYDFSEIVNDLVVKKFKFVEEELGSRNEWELLRRRPAGTGAKLIRFRLDISGSPACAEYDEELRRFPHLRNALRLKGLPPALCIASERSDTIESDYVFSFLEYSSGAPAFISWKQLSISDVAKKSDLARMRYFVYGAGSTGPMGCHQYVTTCVDYKAQRELFDRSLKPSGSSSYLVMHGIPKEGPLWEFYQAENQPRIKEVSFLSDVVPSTPATSSLTGFHEAKYRTSFEQVVKGRPPVDPMGDILVSGDAIYFLQARETKKVLLPAIFRNIELSQILDDRLIIASFYGEKAGILEFGLDGDLVKRIEFSMPKMAWSGDIPRKYYKSIKRKGLGYEIVVLDASGHSDSMEVLGEYIFDIFVPASGRQQTQERGN